MPKLLISRDEWIETAQYGRLEKLNAWHRSGALGIPYTPHENSKPLRAPIFDVSDTSKETAIHKAISFGQFSYALRLLELGKFAETRNEKGETPLIKAVQSGQENIVAALIALGHGLEVIDKKGKNALIHAIHKRSVPIAKLLLDQGVSIASTQKWLPIFEAVASNSHELVSMLLERGANPNEKASSEYVQGLSCLHRMAAYWEQEDSEHETPRRKIMRALLRAGADPRVEEINDEGLSLTLRDSFYCKPGFDDTLPKEISSCEAAQLDQATSPAQRKSTLGRL